MNRLTLVAGLLALVTPAFAADFHIVQNPSTKSCTITEERPAAGAGIVIGVPFGVRVEAENRIKTVKECTGSSTTGQRRGAKQDLSPTWSPVNNLCSS